VFGESAEHFDFDERERTLERQAFVKIVSY
jgi:hypothetical protein